VRSRFSGSVHLTGYFVADIAEELAESLIQASASDDREDESESAEVSAKPELQRKHLAPGLTGEMMSCIGRQLCGVHMLYL